MEQEMRFYYHVHGFTDGTLGSTIMVAHPMISGPGDYDNSDLPFLRKAFDEIAKGVRIPAEVSNFECKEKIGQIDREVRARAKELKEQSL